MAANMKSANASAYKSADFLAGLGFTETGVFASVIDALASNDRERVAGLSDDISGGLHCLASMVDVTADYLQLRARVPREALFAGEDDIAYALACVSDMMRVLAAASDTVDNARYHINREGKQ